MTKELFVVTEEQLETGMRGYPVGYCVTSSVDPEKGLYYRGKKVSEMAEWSSEKVIYLLFYGTVPNESELEAFSNELKKRGQLSKKTVDAIRQLPRDGHPMKLFSASLLLAGMFEATEDWNEDGLNLVARVPELVATLINHHAGWKMNEVSSDLGYMERFTAMIGVEVPDRGPLEQVFKLFNVLHFDHGGGNLSTFTGKCVASGLADLYASLSASIDALSGPRHGKANQDCLEFVKQVLDELGENATAEQVEALIRQRLSNKELVYGFGHAVLRVEDPRATVLYEFSDRFYKNHPLVKIATLLRTAGTKVLKENPKISNPYPNVDAISGTALTAAGFGYPEYFTVLFGLSRVVGITRQIIYERTEARGGKGVPITRPKFYYKGE